MGEGEEMNDETNTIFHVLLTEGAEMIKLKTYKFYDATGHWESPLDLELMQVSEEELGWCMHLQYESTCMEVTRLEWLDEDVTGIAYRRNRYEDSR